VAVDPGSLRVAESSLSASEARYRALFESSPLATWVFDARTFAFLEVNDAAVRQYGYSRDEFAELTLADLEPTDEVDHPHHVDGSPSQERRRWRHRRKDGSLILVEVKTHDFDLDGRPARLMLVIDVTERTRVEDTLRVTEGQLRQAQKMEAVGRLAGGVAHDFNNLLSVILSYSGMLLDQLGEGDAMHADLLEIRRAGERAADLTKQLLLFSRPREVQREVLDLWRLVLGMEKMIASLLGADVELALLGSASAGKVLADVGQLEQVVMNLAVNARDAMPHGGKLTIEVKNAELDEAYAATHLGVTPGPHVMLAVSDTGMGMSKDAQTHAFEPFFTTKEKGKGTGLGLSTVFAIVTQNGGHVRFYSEPGHGTAFHVYLPRTDAAAASVAASQAPPAYLGRGMETILLVEDDPQVRAAATSVLRHCGYCVLEASNGGEALLTCEQHDATIDLLLTDIVLPKLSGRHLAERLTVLRPEMKVLFMSGYTDGAILQNGMLGSDVAFLQKPLTPDALSRKVREVLGPEPG
jgi:two-component system cell cycle sensor histidine kinase/response regulator CckA